MEEGWRPAAVVAKEPIPLQKQVNPGKMCGCYWRNEILDFFAVFENGEVTSGVVCVSKQ